MSQNTARYREVILEFISIYQSEPCLWKVKTELLTYIDKRNAALNKLLTKYKEVDEKADRDAVLKKLNSLRTAYNKEKRKVEESKRSGAGTDAVYEPKLWYYKELSFINDQNVPRASVSSIDDDEESMDEEQQIEQQHIDFENNSQPNEQSSQPNEQSPLPNEQSPQPNEQSPQPNEQSDSNRSTAGNSARRPTPKRKNDDSLINSVLQSVNDHFKRPRDEVRKEDRHDTYCKSVACKLRELPIQQRMLAEKLINDVLFEAECGNLTLECKVINTSLYQMPSNMQHNHHINLAAYQITSPSHSSYQASPSPSRNMQHNLNSPSYITSPSHSSYQASPSPNMHHNLNSPPYITSPSYSSYQASPSPNMQHNPNSPSYRITSPSHSSYQASPSHNIQHPSHSSLQNVQNDQHFSQHHEAPGPENKLSIPEESAASFVVNFIPQ